MGGVYETAATFTCSPSTLGKFRLIVSEAGKKVSKGGGRVRRDYRCQGGREDLQPAMWERPKAWGSKVEIGTGLEKRKRESGFSSGYLRKNADEPGSEKEREKGTDVRGIKEGRGLDRSLSRKELLFSTLTPLEQREAWK